MFERVVDVRTSRIKWNPAMEVCETESPEDAINALDETDFELVSS